jgi:hypothetical protein
MNGLRRRYGVVMLLAGMVLAVMVWDAGMDYWVWGTTFVPSVLAVGLLSAGTAVLHRGRERDG